MNKLFQFWGAFLKPYIRLLIPLVFLNMIPGLLLSIRPLVLAPVLGTVLPSDAEPARSLGDVTLDNLGATLQSVVGNPSGDLMTAFFLSGLLYVGISLCTSLIGGSVTLWSMSIRLKMLKDMTIALHRHLMRLDLAYFLNQKTGNLISRFSTDLTKTAGSLEIVFSGIMKSLIQLMIYAAILFRSDSLLAMQVLLVGSLHMFVTYGLGGFVKRLTTLAYDGLARLTEALQETFQNIRVIKSFSAEQFDARKIEAEAESVRSRSYRFFFARYLEDPIRLFADAIVTASILYISYNAIIQERMTLAGIALFFYMASQLVVPVSELSRHILTIYAVVGGFARLVDMFDTRPTLDDGNYIPNSFENELRLQGICYSFDKLEVLNNISLTIKKGETIGIVGPSGAGKSTLIDLILRLIDPKEGCINLDGKDIKEFRQEAYRMLFGVVSQECLLFNTNIEENITLGRPFVLKDLERACRIANLGTFVRQLPDKYNTVVGDRGIRVSGGQRQRIAIARAVYAHPEILVLDEATSALDTVSEKKVQEAINRAINGVTAIIVAHRLSTILHADKIIVLCEGRVESIGSHEQLLNNSALYKDLYAQQFNK